MLSNPEKRALYDRFGAKGVESGGRGHGHGGVDLMDLLSGGRGQRQRGPPKAKPKLYPLEISLEDSFNGCTKTITHPRQRNCKACDGKGGKNLKTCTTCRGHGVVEKLAMLGPGMYTKMQQHCGDCGGEGRTMNEADRCATCKGQRVIREEKKLDVGVEPGTPHNHDIIFTGESDEEPGVMAGDLYVRVQIKDHPIFKTKGPHLFMKKTISLREALLGVHMEIDFLDGKKLKVASFPGECVKPQEIKVIKNEGMPHHKDLTQRGNLYI